MIDCSKIRNFTINQIASDGDVFGSVVYFNIETGLQLLASEVSKCKNIQAIAISCAVVCTPTEIPVDNNCWLNSLETCWLTASGNFWAIQ